MTKNKKIQKKEGTLDMNQSLLTPFQARVIGLGVGVAGAGAVYALYDHDQLEDENTVLDDQNDYLQGQLANMTANDTYKQWQLDNEKANNTALQYSYEQVLNQFYNISNAYNITIENWAISNDTYLQDMADLYEQFQDMMDQQNLTFEQRYAQLNSLWQNISAAQNATAYENGQTFNFGVEGFDLIWNNILTQDERMAIMDPDQYNDIKAPGGIDFTNFKGVVPRNAQGEILFGIDSKLIIDLSNGFVRTEYIDTGELLEWDEYLG